MVVAKLLAIAVMTARAEQTSAESTHESVLTDGLPVGGSWNSGNYRVKKSLKNSGNFIDANGPRNIANTRIGGNNANGPIRFKVVGA
ncbi:hypothetical protein FH608_048720 [Nonomuraea phyllanthi]|uniref:Uncharacterized protein n=1 Tax=Nonomuraea phyllanthi TaxID=2219224 RepID=A0A5C4UZK4_9ACTN|nr:hypothetical protein [Nonomuraea phyllanthi]KAB8183924.1 hypothetical protein FH608_048720 [Nonomuraea phyllanthi]QFY07970.1 hypothetical protein GBF35_15945 [Nonomuraea phyllanthi]